MKCFLMLSIFIHPKSEQEEMFIKGLIDSRNGPIILALSKDSKFIHEPSHDVIVDRQIVYKGHVFHIILHAFQHP